MYGPPVYNAERQEYYLILPDPSDQIHLSHHIARVKVRQRLILYQFRSQSYLLLLSVGASGEVSLWVTLYLLYLLLLLWWW